MSRARLCRQAARGFSLLEVVAVVAIVGILSSMAVISISQATNRQRSRDAVAGLIDGVRRARNLATTTSCPVTLTVVQPRSLVLTPDAVVCPSVPAKTVVLDALVASLSGPTVGGTPVASVVFQSRGGHTAGGLARFSVTTSLGDSANVVVWPGAGFVRRSMRRTPLRGMTVVEVMVAASLSIGALAGATSAAVTLLAVAEQNARSTTAIHLAETQLENLILLPRDAQQLEATAHALWYDKDGAPVLAAADAAYTTSWTVLADTPIAGTRRVTVTTSWVQRGGVQRRVSLATVRP